MILIHIFVRFNSLVLNKIILLNMISYGTIVYRAINISPRILILIIRIEKILALFIVFNYEMEYLKEGGSKSIKL